MLYIDDKIAYTQYKDYLNTSPSNLKIKGSIITTDDYTVTVEDEYSDILDIAKTLVKSDYENKLIYGKDQTEGIVSIELKDSDLWLYFNDGTFEKRPAKFWICADNKLDKNFKRMKGNSHYKFIRTFENKNEYNKFRNIYRKKDIFVVWNDIEAQMISKGLTLFKGLKVEDVSVLSFDIEGAGLVRDESSQAFVITNTLRKNGETTVTQFREDDYIDQGYMINAWCKWVREVDPDVLNGHNVFGYDLDYLRHVAEQYGIELDLGRDGSPATFGTKPKNYRVDGSQTWEYKNCNIFGRHVIDGMFLAVKYDIGRNYPSWGLKPIAEYEGIVAEDRQFYDASQIGKNWSDPVEREKIVKYCEHDGNDSLALYELMIPSFFYMCQSIPKPFQVIVNSASGSWLNTIMLRSYLQDFHSVPKTQKSEEYGKVSGGVSFGISGIHDNVFKIDIKSMYPSIMLAYNVNDPKKDPDNNFFNMVEHFTNKRFEQKGMYKETGDKYYDDLQAASKIFINSCYGMLGTPGLNFNNFAGADLITGMGRQIIRETMKWATGKDIGFWWNEVAIDKDVTKKLKPYDFEKDRKYDGTLEVKNYKPLDFVMVNADTDSISFRHKNGDPIHKLDMEFLINDINEILPDRIEYEDDGYFDRIVVVKAKNYVLKSGDKIKFKGSSLTDSKKEPALIEMLHRVINESLIYETTNPVDIYYDYIKEVMNIEDISRWCTKKSVTATLLSSERANETKVVDALEGTDYSIGDKVFLYNKIEGMKQAIVKGEPVFLKKTGEPKMVENCILKLQQDFDGDYDKYHYVERVYKTFKILENVLDMNLFMKYNLKANRKLLEEL